MTELLTAAQMRAIEQAAIDSGEVTGLELMERAGQGVVEAIFEEWPELDDNAGERGAAVRPETSPRRISAKPKRAVVLCGPGNNGGDGFVVARLLSERGWVVEVFLYGDAERLPPDARVNYERWCGIGETSPLIDSAFDGRDVEGSGDIVVDALFGTGLTRPFLNFRHLSMWLNTCNALSEKGRGPHVVAVDFPSGLCSDSGRWLGDDDPLNFAGLANLTVTFHRKKLGHILCDGSWALGRVKTAEIGLPDWWRSTRSLRWRDVVSACDRPEGIDLFHISKKEVLNEGNKFRHGHAFIISGGQSNTGAARLSARGSLRIGAGLVTLGVPSDARQEAAAQLTAIMLREIENESALTDSLKDERINALCIGPALGLDRAKPLVSAALKQARATVLDADALSAFADEPEALFEMLHDKCILTPHGGEFARLFPDISEKLNEVPTKGPAYSKVDATREAAKRAGCVVLFKGAATVIAAPDGRCSIHSAHYERSAPWLATAGSGDVLAGFITGLLARGFEPMQAAETAAWLHVECALKFGPGLIAEDIPEQLPAVFRDLGL